jgi:hypothetical protein
VPLVTKELIDTWFLFRVVDEQRLLLSPPALCPALFLLPLGRPIVKTLVGVTKSRVSLLKRVAPRQTPFAIGTGLLYHYATVCYSIFRVFFVVPTQRINFIFHV